MSENYVVPYLTYFADGGLSGGHEGIPVSSFDELEEQMKDFARWLMYSVDMPGIERIIAMDSQDHCLGILTTTGGSESWKCELASNFILDNQDEDVETITMEEHAATLDCILSALNTSLVNQDMDLHVHKERMKDAGITIAHNRIQWIKLSRAISELVGLKSDPGPIQKLTNLRQERKDVNNLAVIRGNQVLHLQQRILELGNRDQEISDLTDDLASSRKRFNTIKSELIDYCNKFEAAEIDHKAEIDRLNERMETSTTASDIVVHNLGNENDVLKVERDKLNVDVADSQRQFNSAQHDLKEAEERIKNLQNGVPARYTGCWGDPIQA